jgi:hypothetical protein
MLKGVIIYAFSHLLAISSHGDGIIPNLIKYKIEVAYIRWLYTKQLFKTYYIFNCYCQG